MFWAELMRGFIHRPGEAPERNLYAKSPIPRRGKIEFLLFQVSVVATFNMMIIKNLKFSTCFHQYFFFSPPGCHELKH